MKIKKNWILWTFIFVCLVVIWISRDSYLSYRLSVERAKSKYELEIKKQQKIEERVPRMDGKNKPTAIQPTKQPIDVWGWAVKAGVFLSGLKTLLDIIDKFKLTKKRRI